MSVYSVHQSKRLIATCMPRSGAYGGATDVWTTYESECHARLACRDRLVPLAWLLVLGGQCNAEATGEQIRLANSSEQARAIQLAKVLLPALSHSKIPALKCCDPIY